MFVVLEYNVSRWAGTGSGVHPRGLEERCCWWCVVVVVDNGTDVMCRKLLEIRCIEGDSGM